MIPSITNTRLLVNSLGRVISGIHTDPVRSPHSVVVFVRSYKKTTTTTKTNVNGSNNKMEETESDDEFDWLPKLTENESFHLYSVAQQSQPEKSETTLPKVLHKQINTLVRKRNTLLLEMTIKDEIKNTKNLRLFAHPVASLQLLLTQEKKTNMAIEWIDTMRSYNIPRAVYNYTIVINALVKEKRQSEAEKLLVKCKNDLNYLPAITYGIILRGLCYDHMSEATTLLAQLLRDNGEYSREDKAIFLKVMIKVLLKQNNVHTAIQWHESFIALFGETCISYNVLGAAILRLYPNPSSLINQLLTTMKKKKIPYDSNTYRIEIEYLLHHKHQYNEAEKILMQLITDNREGKPDCVPLTQKIFNCFFRYISRSDNFDFYQLKHLITLSAEFSFYPSPSTVKHLMASMAKRGPEEEIEKFLESTKIFDDRTCYMTSLIGLVISFVATKQYDTASKYLNRLESFSYFRFISNELSLACVKMYCHSHNLPAAISYYSRAPSIGALLVIIRYKIDNQLLASSSSEENYITLLDSISSLIGDQSFQSDNSISQIFAKILEKDSLASKDDYVQQIKFSERLVDHLREKYSNLNYVQIGNMIAHSYVLVGEYDAALSQLEKMHASKLQLNLLVLEACLSQGATDPALHSRISAFFKALGRDEYHFSARFYDLLIRNFTIHNRLVEVMYFLDCMAASKITPQKATLNIIIKYFRSRDDFEPYVHFCNELLREAH